MKINRKLRNILTISAGIGAVSLMVIPAITLTSCSSASNSYYPTTKVSLNSGKSVLGLNVPDNFELNNGTNSLTWNNTFYGFSSAAEIEKMYKEVMTNNGLNVYHPSEQDDAAWCQKHGYKPLPKKDDFKFVNRLPFAAVNALTLYQHTENVSITYAKMLQKSLINLGVPSFDDSNPYSLTKLFSQLTQPEQINQMKQLVYGLTVGVGQAGDSYFLGMSGLDMQISASNQDLLNPNSASSLINPGNEISGNTEYIVKDEKNSTSSKTVYKIDQDVLDNKTTTLITITPTVSYSWYKQLQTGGSPLGQIEVANLLQKHAVSGKDDVYNNLGDLKTNYSIQLAPITIAIKQAVTFKNLTQDSDGNLTLNDKSVAITTGAIAPLKFNVGDKNSPIQVAFAFGDLVKSNAVQTNQAQIPATSLKEYAVQATTTQLFLNTINSAQVNGNDNNHEWTENLYKLPFFAYSKYKDLIANKSQSSSGNWDINSIKNSIDFNNKFGTLSNKTSVLGWYNEQINSNTWIKNTTPGSSNIETLLTSFKVS